MTPLQEDENENRRCNCQAAWTGPTGGKYVRVNESTDGVAIEAKS